MQNFSKMYFITHEILLIPSSENNIHNRTDKSCNFSFFLNSIMNYLNPHGNLVGMLDCAVEEFFFFFYLYCLGSLGDLMISLSPTLSSASPPLPESPAA